MRILQNSFFVFFIVFCTSIASAAEVLRFDQSVAGFVNYNRSQSLLFMTENGQANFVSVSDAPRITHTASYKITNPNCVPFGQNTTTMDGSHTGMTLAYPFLVGVGWACIIDEATNTINLISEFPLPENPYSIVYAGEDQNTSYFLMNNKLWSGIGYLHLVSIDKNTHSITTKIVAQNVTGYSGAMLFDSGDVWVTVWPGKIYKILQQNVVSLWHATAPVNFAQLAQLEFSNISGMSLFMLTNNHSLLYYNDEYESYTVQKENKKVVDASLSCVPISGYNQDWLVLCNGTSLQTWHQ